MPYCCGAVQREVRVTPERWQACGNTALGFVVRPCAKWGSMKGRSRDTRRMAVAACAAPLAAWAGTGEPDTQLWTEADVTGPLATNTTITGVARVRLSESEPNPTLLSPGVDLNYRAGKWTVSAGYRYNATAEREPETIGGKSSKISQVALLMGRRAWRFGRNTLAVRLRLDDTLNASSNRYRARVRLE